MTEGSLFAGIMGFGEGFRRAGFTSVWAIEKEPFCQAVIRTRFPETELFSDVKDCGKHNLRAVDVITAGFPCQDLSVAGKRAGLEGSRSGLFWQVVRILGELKPPWFVIENVPGLFSSAEGRDFGIILKSLDELGYGLAWRVLDSQFFGVAQRRRRVFIVGRFGGPCPQEVLFEPEGGTGDLAESGETGQDIAYPLTSGVGVTGNPPGRRREDDYNIVARALSNSGVSSGYRYDPNGEEYVVGSLAAHSREHGHAMSTQQAAESGQLVNCLAPVGGGADDNDGQAGHIVPVSSRVRLPESGNGTSAGEQSLPDSQSLPHVSRELSDSQGGEDCREHAVAYALRQDPGGTGQGHNTNCAISFNIHSANSCVRERHAYESERARSLDTSGGFAPSQGGTVVGTIGCREKGRGPDPSEAASGQLISTSPDSHGMRDFTRLPKGMDSPRYRALGNAVTVQVAEWIGRRILEAEREQTV